MAMFNRWWVVVASIFGLMVGNGPIMQFTFGIFLMPLTQAFGWSRSETSFALVAGLTMTAISVPFAGRLIDRFGIRAVTLPSIVLMALCLVGLSTVATTPERFVALYALMGIAAAGQTPLPYAKAITSWFDSRRGLALGVAMSGVGLGAALMPQVTQFVVNEMSWQAAYLALAVIMLVVGLPAVALAVKESPKTASNETGAQSTTSTSPFRLAASFVFKLPVFWLMAFSFFAVALATNGTIAHIVPMLVDRQIEASVAVGAMAFAGLALIVGRLLAGYLLDRYHAPYVAVAFIALPLAGISLMLFAQTPVLAAAAVVLVGMGLGAEVDLIAYLQSRYIGTQHFGEVYGYFFTLFMLGSGVGPFVMGLVFDHTGTYSLALASFCGLLVLSCLALVRLGEYRFGTQRHEDKSLTTVGAH
ncbi:MAG: MFS transporter [Pontibacterium sp.]